MQKIRFYLLVTFVTVSLSIKAGTTGSVASLVHLADSLKAMLTSTQISNLQLSYSYANAQTWSNLPAAMSARKGIQLGSLTTAQLGAAKEIIKEMSNKNVANEGYDEIVQLWLADDYLAANGGGTTYGAGNYYLAFFGTPSLIGTFEIMMTGHHKTVANTYNNGVMVGPTPHFEAIEPLSFTTSGTTYAPMNQEKTAFAAMLAALSTTELASAKLSTTFGDVLLGAANGGPAKDWQFPTTKVGLRVGTLTSTQKNLVFEAIKTYVLDVDSVNAVAILAQYKNQLDSTYIAYSGTNALATKNDYVRIDGAGVWIEFSVQRGIIMSGVHYHSIWRDHKRDFGGTGGSGIFISPVGSDTTSILPIGIESTSVYKLSNNTISINWKTAYEINNNHFEIEFSKDGKFFETIATISSSNNLQGSSYNYTHNNPQKGKNYYRIKSVDNDGRFQYSKIFLITVDSKATASIYPNPTTNKIIVSHNLEGTQTFCNIYNVGGRLVLTKTTSNRNTINVDVCNLPNGLYVLSLNSGGQSIQSKFIKQ